MGLSGQKGDIWILPYKCVPNLNGTLPPGVAHQISEEVTKFDITPSIFEKRYGHNRSHGATDSCTGTKSWDAVIQSVVRDPARKMRGAGTLIYLLLYPFGRECGTPIQGYGTIITPSYSITQEDGQPNTCTITVHNKGLWLGFDNDGQPWGGFECTCGGSGSGSIWN